MSTVLWVAGGPDDRMFHDTLLDENAASNIALGLGLQHLAAEGAAADAEPVNSSAFTPTS